MNQKKGQGLSTNAIILIILGVIVLAILILGFTIGWSRFIPFLKTNNVDNVKTACDLACSTGAQYDFCSTQRDINDGVNPKFSTTCYNLATNTTLLDRGYGISNSGCPSLCS